MAKNTIFDQKQGLSTVTGFIGQLKQVLKTPSQKVFRQFLDLNNFLPVSMVQVCTLYSWAASVVLLFLFNRNPVFWREEWGRESEDS